MPTRPPTFRPPCVPTRTENRASSTARGYDAAWRRLRHFHLINNPLCVECEDYAEEVDHVVPVSVDPSRRLDPANLRSLCKSCHSLITSNIRVTGRNEMPARPNPMPMGGWA